MTKHIALAVVLSLTTFVGTGLAQELSADGCLSLAPKIEPGPGVRSHVTWVTDAHGETKAVRSQVREMRVARLNFEGQTRLSEFQQEQIAESLTEGGYDDDKEGLSDLRSRIVDAWQQQGYFRARVDLRDVQTLDESVDTRTLAITATVQAGKQYLLDEIQFSDLSSGAATTSTAVVTDGARFSAAELRSHFLIQQGDVFDTHKVQKGLEQLRREYGARGFINMSAVPAFQIDEKTDQITVIMEIDEGRQFRIGHISVLGLAPAVSRKLLQSSGLIPGNVFDATSLERFYRENPAALPTGFSAENYTERRLDEQKATVDLFLKVPCAAP